MQNFQYKLIIQMLHCEVLNLTLYWVLALVPFVTRALGIILLTLLIWYDLDRCEDKVIDPPATSLLPNTLKEVDVQLILLVLRSFSNSFVVWDYEGVDFLKLKHAHN